MLSACAGGPGGGGAYKASHSSAEMAGGDGERPGLGTGWGERRHSEVREVAFHRCDGEPTAAVAIHYDDADGIAAMLDVDLRAGARPNTLAAGALSVAIVDERGRALPGLPIGDRNYIVGEHGARYEIVIENGSDQRYEIVASVDGLDVVDGQPASWAKRGYVIAPHTAIRIDGWRTSLTDVAAFRFGSVADSYAARTDTDRNVGVIGVAFFCERGATQPGPFARDPDEPHRRHAAEPFPAN